jgi:hypothetical protein
MDYILHNNIDHLEGILELQNKNLKANLTKEEMVQQGFVTITHNLEVLYRMGGDYKHVLAMGDDKVIAYALSTSPEMVVLIPELKNLVKQIESLIIGERNLSSYEYLIMGQVCIDINYRGKGVFTQLYNTMREHYAEKVPYLITEISSSNRRSLRAHQKVGFREIHRHIDELDEWIIVLWDWQNI